MNKKNDVLNIIVRLILLPVLMYPGRDEGHLDLETKRLKQITGASYWQQIKICEILYALVISVLRLDPGIHVRHY